MKIDVLSRDTIENIYDLVVHINKSSNMTALVLPELNEDRYFVIRIESL